MENKTNLEIGDIVYRIYDNKIQTHEISEIEKGYGWAKYSTISKSCKGFSFGVLDVGKTVFLSEAESEQSLLEIV